MVSCYLFQTKNGEKVFHLFEKSCINITILVHEHNSWWIIKSNVNCLQIYWFDKLQIIWIENFFSLSHFIYEWQPMFTVVNKHHVNAVDLQFICRYVQLPPNILCIYQILFINNKVPTHVLQTLHIFFP